MIQPQNDQDLFAPSEGPTPTHTHTHSHSDSRWIKLNCLSLITFCLVPYVVSSSDEELLEVLNQSLKDETHTNHVASTNNVNSN